MSKPKARKALEREFEVRLATPKDAAVISELIREAFGPFESQYTKDAFEYTTPPADVISERFAEGPIWVAVENGSIIGTVSGLPEPERFYIRSMAVKPDIQGRGVGQRLLENLEAHARDSGFERLYLYTTFVLPAARQLYEKNGFTVVRETKPEEWFDMAGLEMEKRISFDDRRNQK
jgi:N-acetylglutamate synthase-like GNAT family acetyltransferase